jgi:hypothetical protein
MSMTRRALVLASLAVIGGCVLFIDPIETNDHCGIQGSGACADCLRRTCQTAIDRCCNTNACAGSRMLPGIDACGRGEIAPCADILGAPRLQENEEDLRSCAKVSCGQVCTQGSTGTGASTNRAEWTCATARDPTTDCASCVYQSCATIIDSCCAESSCKIDSTIQTDMGACVSGDAPGCAFSRDDSRGTTGQAGVLRKCLLEKCGTRCMGNGLPHTKCTLYSQGDYCQCSNDETAGTQKCNEQTIPGADCVLGTDGCTCGQYSCSDDTSGSGCSCSFTGGGVVGTSCTAPTDRVCCVSQTTYGISCECRYSSCYGTDEVEISSCSKADVPTWADPAVVTSCSR